MRNVPPSCELVNLNLVDGVVIVLPGPGVASDDLRELWVSNALQQIVQVEVEAVVHIWPAVKEPCQLERALQRPPAGQAGTLWALTLLGFAPSTCQWGVTSQEMLWVATMVSHQSVGALSRQ